MLDRTRHMTAEDAADHSRPRIALDRIPEAAWDALAARSAEPNGYQLGSWVRAVNHFAEGRGGAFALSAWQAPALAPDKEPRLIGLMPVVTCQTFYRLPLPVLVSADNYSALCTPLLDADAADAAAAQLLQQARANGARALVLRDVPLEGPTLAAFTRALAAEGLAPHVLTSYARACLDARGDADTILRNTLSAQRLKGFRRQRRRLAERAPVRFVRTNTTEKIGPALDSFLRVEASGWKGARGTALLRRTGDLAFIRQAVRDLTPRGQCEIISLLSGETPIAAAIILRHRDRAFYYKLGIDERFAKFSPGVMLTLELTKMLCEDPAIRFADSTADADNTLVDPIWPQRLVVGDVFIPLSRNDLRAFVAFSALKARLIIREPLRRIVRALRAWRRKRRTAHRDAAPEI